MNIKTKHIIYAAVIASAPLFAGNAAAQDEAVVEPTLWGIYGKHNLHDCPVNDIERAKYVIAASQMDLTPLMEKYGVVGFVDRYHSGLEHTFLWVVETTRPHDLEEFTIELGLASWNDLTFVPVRTFEEGVVETVRELHGLQDWEPGDE